MINKTIKTLGVAGLAYLGLSLAQNAYAQDAKNEAAEKPAAAQTEKAEKKSIFKRLFGKKPVQPSKPAGLKSLETRISQLSPDEKADVVGADNPETLFGKASLRIVSGPNGKVDVNPVTAIELAAGDKNPADFSWILSTTVDGKPYQTTVFSRKGKIFQPLYDETGKSQGIQEVDPTILLGGKTGYRVSSGVLLNQDEGKIMLLYKCHMNDDLLKIFGGGIGGKYLYGKQSKEAGVIDLDSYDGAYVVFSNAIDVGGKPALFAKLSPFYQLGKGIQKAQVGGKNIERNLQLTAITPDDLKKIKIKDSNEFEKLIRKLARKGGCSDEITAVPFDQKRLRIGYSNSNSTVTTPRYRGGLKVGESEKTTPTNGVEGNLEGRIWLPSGVYLGGEVSGAYLFEPEIIGTQGNVNVGYAFNTRAGKLGVHAGVAGSYTDDNLDSRVSGLYGPNAGIVFTPIRGTELIASYRTLKGTIDNDGDKDTNASRDQYEIGIRQQLGSFVLGANGIYTKAEQFENETSHADLEVEATKYILPGIGVYARGKTGKMIKVNESNSDQKNYGVKAGVEVNF